MEILRDIKYEDVVFIDIETTRCVNQFDPDTDLGRSWSYKMKYIKGNESSFEFNTPGEAFVHKAALYAEFAKVICVTVGRYDPKTDQMKFKSYYIEQDLAVEYKMSNRDEKELLSKFCMDLEAVCARNKNTRLCGFSIVGFDIPFLAKRCIVNDILVPEILDIAHLKPWEVTVLDLHTIWKGTSFYGASLPNVCVALGLPFSKTEMSGSETSEEFYSGNINRIVKYCESDVTDVINVFRKMKGETVLIKSDSLKEGTPEWTEVVARLHSGFDLDLKKICNEYVVGANELVALKAIAEESSKTRRWENVK